MSLTNQSKEQNVKASVEKYISENLAITELLTIDFEGIPFESSGSKEWIQERFMASNSTDSNSMGRKVGGQKTTTKQAMISFNIFVNKERATKANRHYELRDKIADYFEVGEGINLYDAENGDFSTVLQVMIVDEIITDMVIPNDDYLQYNYTVGIEWLSKRN